MGDKIHGPDTKPRSYDRDYDDYSVDNCPDQGGKYQELKHLGDFCEITGGTRLQRLHGRNYCKTSHEKAAKDTLGGIVDAAVHDTHGPPFENTSAPKRIF